MAVRSTAFVFEYLSKISFLRLSVFFFSKTRRTRQQRASSSSAHLLPIYVIIVIRRADRKLQPSQQPVDGRGGLVTARERKKVTSSKTHSSPRLFCVCIPIKHSSSGGGGGQERESEPARLPLCASSSKLVVIQSRRLLQAALDYSFILGSVYKLVINTQASMQITSADYPSVTAAEIQSEKRPSLIKDVVPQPAFPRSSSVK